MPQNSPMTAKVRTSLTSLERLEAQIRALPDGTPQGAAWEEALVRWVNGGGHPDLVKGWGWKQWPGRADGLPPGSKRIRKWTPAPWGEVGANLSIVLAHAPLNAPTLLAALQAQEVLGRRIRDQVRHQLLLLGQEPGWTDTVARLNKELLARGVTYKYIPGA
jgi:hypothetical protein